VRVRIAAVLAVGLLTLSAGGAVGQAPPSARPLIAGVFEAPPFSMKTPAGGWEGISIDLWQAIAQDLRLAFALREVRPEAALTGVTSGAIDVLVSPVVVSPEREELVDFTHIFYTTGLAIAVPRRSEELRWTSLARAVLSPALLGVVLGLVGLLVVAGLMIWLLERKRNPAFGGPPLPGIGAAVWWSTVTFTTVGYGDKVPVTVAGRLVAIVWMLASVVLVSAFTGFVTARIAISHFEEIRGRGDLANFRIGVVNGSEAAAYLTSQRVNTRAFGSLAAGMGALTQREIDGFVHGEAIVRYLVKAQYGERLEVLPELLEREYYAFALRTGDSRREAVNLALLRVLAQPRWHDIQFRYLGTPRRGASPPGGRRARR
jgi:polar amino acid transport system substrate-binding protein